MPKSTKQQRQPMPSYTCHNWRVWKLTSLTVNRSTQYSFTRINNGSFRFLAPSFLLTCIRGANWRCDRRNYVTAIPRKQLMEELPSTLHFCSLQLAKMETQRFLTLQEKEIQFYANTYSDSL
ncbi:hypothetical protein Celaphus_00010214, partial [Cervus elaphus hippelaphus]